MPVLDAGKIQNTGVEKSKFQTLVYSRRLYPEYRLQGTF